MDASARPKQLVAFTPAPRLVWRMVDGRRVRVALSQPMPTRRLTSPPTAAEVSVMISSLAKKR